MIADETSTLVQLLVQHAPPDVRTLLHAMEDLPTQVEQLYLTGTTAWPHVPLPPERFILHVAGHLVPGVCPCLLNAPGMYLAAACLQGQSSALKALDSLLQTVATKVVPSMDPSPAFRDEVLQEARLKLLMAHGSNPPRISTYAGRGSLEGWLRMVVLRVALNLRRTRPLEDVQSMEEALQQEGVLDLERDFIRREYQDDFRAAFQSALQLLTDQQRALLRLYLVHDMGIDQLAVVLHVGRSTAARRLAAARNTLRQETHRILSQRLDLSPSELRSLVRVMHSHMVLSMKRHLDQP